MLDPARDHRRLRRAAAILRRELLLGEPENEILAKMLAHSCERAADGDEQAQLIVDVMEPEVALVPRVRPRPQALPQECP